MLTGIAIFAAGVIVGVVLMVVWAWTDPRFYEEPWTND